MKPIEPIPPEPSIQTFTLKLTDRIFCTAQIDFQAISDCAADRILRQVVFQKSGQWREQHFPQYLEWSQTVWQHVADTSGKRFIVFYKQFALVFRPNCPRERILGR